MSPTFRKTLWDPTLIISQIISLQCVFYLGLGLWVFLMDKIISSHISLEQLFDYKELQFKDLHGRLLMAAFLLNSLTCSLGLWVIVTRSKQCLDFACTSHLVHLVSTLSYTRGSFPSTLSWWLLSLVSLTLMTVLGEYLCMRSEMKSIPLSSSSSSSSSMPLTSSKADL